MHDIRAIRENPAAFDAALSRRGLPSMSSQILALDEERRAMIQAAEVKQAEMNRLSKQAGAAKGAGNEVLFEMLRAEVAVLKSFVGEVPAKAAALDAALRDLLMTIPNLPLAEIPDGVDEDHNLEIRRSGTLRNFDFQPLEHYDIPGVKPGMDFETAAKLSGARFVVLKGAVIRVHRALAQF
ncbi:MAG: serine--tRNA ligase, partial [Paracoccaceae bacterium]